MVKVYDIGTFRMCARGGHFAIVVLSALGRLTMVVSSTIPALCASIGDSGVVKDDRREPPRIEGHRPGPLGILSDQDSLLATTARCQWCSTTGSLSKGRVSFILVQNPERRPGWDSAQDLSFEPFRAGQGSRRRLMVTFLSDALP